MIWDFIGRRLLLKSKNIIESPLGYNYKRIPGVMEIYLSGFMAFSLNSNANELRQRS